MRRRHFLSVAIVLVVPVLVVEACGPYFYPAVFVPAHRPSVPKNFAKGRLGVLQPGYYIAEKVVAFRYLNGGTLNDDEQRQLAPIAPPGVDYDNMTDAEQKASEAADKMPAAQDRWNAARGDYAQPVAVSQDKAAKSGATDDGWEERVVNCGDSAFDTAIRTLADRAAKWGGGSDVLKNWIAAQDAVFSHCSGDGPMPGEAPANAPLLLKQDRAYQMAATSFYAGAYPAARDGFLKIARDKSSPWSRWGMYLAARCAVRQAAKAGVSRDNYEQAQFDQAGLESARELLLQAATTADPVIKHAAEAELGFVMIRIDPVKQTSVLANSLAGPGHDRDFGQHLVDLRFLLDHGSYGDAPLLRWMTATGSPWTYSLPPSTNGPRVSPAPGAEWQKHPDLPGLVAALMGAKTGSPEMMQASAQVLEGSPAYVTVQFHRARLLAEANDLEGARQIATHALELARKQDAVEAANALLEVRMKTATDLKSLLEDAPRTMLSGDGMCSTAGLQEERLGLRYDGSVCTSPAPVMQLDGDAAQVFNTRLPLTVWIDAARNEALPKHLRDTLALSAWLRALVLGRDAEAESLMPLLPSRVQTSLAKSSMPTGYAATLVLLHSPGLRPFLDAGVQRAVTYTESDHYRNNQWCSTMDQAVGANAEDTNAPAIPISEPAFLTAAQQQQARAEVAALDEHANGMEWLGRRTIDYVKAHPEEPVAAESLALVVQLTRYECSGSYEAGKSPSSNVSKEAFTLLHSRYPKSEWALKTKYFF